MDLMLCPYCSHAQEAAERCEVCNTMRPRNALERDAIRAYAQGRAGNDPRALAIAKALGAPFADQGGADAP